MQPSLNKTVRCPIPPRHSNRLDHPVRRVAPRPFRSSVVLLGEPRQTTQAMVCPTSMRHRVHDVVDADAYAERRESFRVLRIVRVLPGIAQIHVVTNGAYQASALVVDAPPSS